MRLPVRDKSAWIQRLTGGSMAIALGLPVTSSVRAGDDGPVLSAPLGLPAEAPARPAVVSSPKRRGPVLALPGITTPPTHAAVPEATTASDSLMPSLDAPVGMSHAPAPARAAEPLLIESFPIESLTTVPDRPASTRPAPRREASLPSTSPKPSSTPPPARRPWFFANPRPGTAPARLPAKSVRPVPAAEAKADPAADLALKRTIERQARAAIGNHARSLEVRVVGKQVSVEARGVRMLQKRGVRKALEGLPALSGLRSAVTVLD